MTQREQMRPFRPALKRPPELVLRKYDEIQRKNPTKNAKAWYNVARTSRTIKALPNGTTYVVADYPEVHQQLGGFLELEHNEKPLIIVSSRLNSIEQENLAIKLFEEWSQKKVYRKAQLLNFARGIKARYIELVKTVEPQLIAQLARCPKDGKRYLLKVGKFEFVGQYIYQKKQYEVSPVLDASRERIFKATNTSSVVFVYKE